MPPKSKFPAPAFWRIAVLEHFDSKGRPDPQAAEFYEGAIAMLDGIYGGPGRANVARKDQCNGALAFAQKFLREFKDPKYRQKANVQRIIGDWVMSENYPIGGILNLNC